MLRFAQVRWLMVAVAIAALLMLPVVWWVQFEKAIGDFYKPGGTLETQYRTR